MKNITETFDIEKLKFDEHGWIPCIVQDDATNRVLTLAYMNRESLTISLERGLTCFYSRSRRELWLKGETSGNYQHIVSIEADCDCDALLVRVRKDGPACHRGYDSCFDASMKKTWGKPSETKDEVVDVYDRNRQKTGAIVSRKARLQPGEYMMYVLALLETEDHRFLITQRSFDKKWAAGAWEIPGGAGQSSESSYEALCREVYEETGLDLKRKLHDQREKARDTSTSFSSTACSAMPMHKNKIEDEFDIFPEEPKPIYTYFNEDPERGDNYFVDIYHFVLSFREEELSISQAESIDHRLATLEEITALNDEKSFLHYGRIQEALEKERSAAILNQENKNESGSTMEARCSEEAIAIEIAKDVAEPARAPHANFHMHSLYCDGKNSITEMAQTAAEKGLTKIGFSGHLDPGVCMTDLQGYFREIEEVQKIYAGQMQILTGLEVDNVYEPVNFPKVEYTIGSTHFIPCPDSPVWNHPVEIGTRREGTADHDLICVDHTPETLHKACEQYYGGDFYKLAEDYFRFEAMVAERLHPTFIGHFDLITRFNDLPVEEGGQFLDEEDPRYLAAGYRAIETLVRAGLPFEVNLGSVNRGRKKYPYPAPAFMRKLYECKAELILSSDAHDCDHIDAAFSEGAEYIRSFGFTHVNVLTRRDTGTPAGNSAQREDFLSCEERFSPLYWEKWKL